ncbi:aldose 1-epimerase family protein ['Paenibacillus yunnanensis' Narsing Rao et al. 2020]|uniref:aldose 1-epimerase family protein n=1 Tax=Paenibacillus tengchongensis TaxID=2608684 RepID=UPI00124EDDFD|nr:aldose 1-epimerase family protein [Paenibacillus tengchongensis]
MNTILHNAVAQAEISSLGAELISFKRKDNGTEYMWSGDAAYWTGRSPVLFPIIGAARNGAIQVDGQAYSIGNHGFARRSEFTLVESDDIHAVFRLTQDDKTLAAYPYKFSLYLTYTLTGSTLEIAYRVENPDNQEIHFQLGTHPAFNCPPDGQGSFSDYVLEFGEAEPLERLFLTDAGLIIAGKSEPLLGDTDTLPLNHEMFYAGALVFRNVRSRRIILKSAQSERSVSVSFEGFPDLGIWQPKDAPFVCIEPWHGVADGEDFAGELHDKEGIITLAPGASHAARLTVSFN